MMPTFIPMQTRPWRSNRRQRGVSLITAIFLVVVLSALAGAIGNIYVSQQTSSAIDVLGVRALQAARAGVEWGVYQQTRLNSCAGTTSFALPAGTTLSSFTVTVNCTWTADTKGPFVTKLAHPSVTSAGSATVTGVDTTDLIEGMPVWGTGITPGTLILRIDSATQLTLTKVANAINANLLYYSTLDTWSVTAVACSIPTGGACSDPANNPTNHKDFVQRRMQVKF